MLALDFQELSPRYKINISLLEGLIKSIRKNNRNSLLSDDKKLKESIEEGTWLVAVAYNNRYNNTMNLHLKEKVQLRREHNNPYDRNAILVLTGEKELGYIEKNLAQMLSVYTDVDLVLEGRVIDLERSNKITQVKIKINFTPKPKRESG